MRPQVESPVEKKTLHTVDSDGNALVESVSISTDESWDLAETVELQVLSRDTLGRLGLNNLEVDIVGLCDSADGGGAGVTLWWIVSFEDRDIRMTCVEYSCIDIPGRCRVFRKEPCL